MSDKIYGTIKWYKKTKQYGYIIGDDEESYYFENANCVNIKEEFITNDRVIFVPNYGEMDYATKVEKIGDNNEKN